MRKVWAALPIAAGMLLLGAGVASAGDDGGSVDTQGYGGGHTPPTTVTVTVTCAPTTVYETETIEVPTTVYDTVVETATETETETATVTETELATVTVTTTEPGTTTTVTTTEAGATVTTTEPGTTVTETAQATATVTEPAVTVTEPGTTVTEQVEVPVTVTETGELQTVINDQTVILSPTVQVVDGVETTAYSTTTELAAPVYLANDSGGTGGAVGSAASTGLAYTGVNSSTLPMIIAGSVLLFLGGALVLGGRRRKAARGTE